MNKNWYLAILLLFATGMSVIEVIAGIKGYEAETSTQLLWGITFFVLTICWVKEDAKIKNYQLPFDFGFLLYVLWPITFPWYLISTRGADGIILFMGFVLIYLGPWLNGLVAYVYST